MTTPIEAVSVQTNRRKVLVYLSCFTFLLCIFFIAMYNAPISPEQAEDISGNITAMAKEATVSFVFGNNFKIAFMGILPIVGCVITSLIMYNTGVAFAAMNATFLRVVSNPFFWIEVPIYALSFYQAINVPYLMFKKRSYKRAFISLIASILLGALILLLAAIAEVWLIRGTVLW